MPYGLGIDLGTSCIVAAVSRAGTGPDVVPLGVDAPGVPTVLHLADDGTMLAGAAAEPLVLSDPDRVFRGFLHRVGEPTPPEPSPPDFQRRPEALTARLARWVVDAVAEREGEPPQRITLAHPAVWGPGQCRVLADALIEFGLPGVVLVPAPVAAATGAGTSTTSGGEQAGDTVAVYDLGATFSASIVRRDSAGFTILGEPRMIEDGGGARFDEVVLAQVLDELGDQMATANLDDQVMLAGMSRLLADCVAAREALSDRPDVTFPVSLPGISAWVRLTGSKLETLIDPTLRATVASLRAVMSAAALTPADVGTVLAVGGCARIPQVARLLDTELGRPVVMLTDPELAVARGAALISAQPHPAAHPAAQPNLPAVQSQIAAGQPHVAGGQPPPLQAFPAEPTERFPADPVPVDDTVRLPRVASTHQSAAGWRTRRRPHTLVVVAAGILAVTTLVLPITLLDGPDSGAGPSTTNDDGSVREPGDPSHPNHDPAYGGALAPAGGALAPAVGTLAPTGDALPPTGDALPPADTTAASTAPIIRVSAPPPGTVAPTGIQPAPPSRPVLSLVPLPARPSTPPSRRPKVAASEVRGPLTGNLVNVAGVLGVESVGERARTGDLTRVDRPRVDRHGVTLEEHLDVGGH